MNPSLIYFEKKWDKLLSKRKKDFSKKARVIRVLSITSTSVLFITVTAIFILIFISQIVPSIQEIANNFDIYSQNLTNYVNDLLSAYPDVEAWIFEMLNRYDSEIQNFLDTTIIPGTSEFLVSVSGSIISILVTFWNIVLGFIISIYLLSSKEVFVAQSKKVLYAIFSVSNANHLLQDMRFVHRTFTGFIFGKVIDSIIIGILCMIGTSILGTPYAVLVSIFIGFTNVIPFFGPFIGAIPSAILIFVVEPTQPLNLLYFLIFILMLQQFDGNILGPKILGDSTGLTGFWVIFSITVFGGFMGIPGMIIGVPTFAVIFAAIRRSINSRLKEKMLPVDRDSYDGLGTIEDGKIVPYVAEAKKDILNKNIINKTKRKNI